MTDFGGFDFYSDRPDKVGEHITGWRVHKTNVDEDSGRVTKVEQYRYMPKPYWGGLEFHLLNSNQYHYVTDKSLFPSIFNIMLNAQGKVLNAKLKPPTQFEHSYLTHFARVIKHRGNESVFLLRAYECVSYPNHQVKFEITYLEEAQQGFRSIRGLRNPLHKLAAMREYKIRIDRRLGAGTQQNYIDHTRGQLIESYVEKIFRDAKGNDPQMYQRMLKYLEGKNFKSWSDLF